MLLNLFTAGLGLRQWDSGHKCEDRLTPHSGAAPLNQGSAFITVRVDYTVGLAQLWTLYLTNLQCVKANFALGYEHSIASEVVL